MLLKESMFWADDTLVLVHQEQDFKVLSFCCKQCLRNIQSITAIPVEICKHSNHAADVASRGLKAGMFLMSDAWLSNLHTVFCILSGTGLQVQVVWMNFFLTDDAEVKVRVSVNVQQSSKDVDAITRLVCHF